MDKTYPFGPHVRHCGQVLVGKGYELGMKKTQKKKKTHLN